MALETGGRHIAKCPDLVAVVAIITRPTLALQETQVIQDVVCKSLLQNSSSPNFMLVSIVLRLVFNLFLSIKEHLKVSLPLTSCL